VEAKQGVTTLVVAPCFVFPGFKRTETNQIGHPMLGKEFAQSLDDRHAIEIIICYSSPADKC
jgi:hypothetical protein